MIEIKNQNLQIENNQKRVDIGDVAPEISLPDTSRQIKNLSDLRGNIVLVNFWASWSPPC